MGLDKHGERSPPPTLLLNLEEIQVDSCFNRLLNYFGDSQKADFD